MFRFRGTYWFVIFCVALIVATPISNLFAAGSPTEPAGSIGHIGNDPVSAPCASGNQTASQSQPFNSCSKVVEQITKDLDKRVKDQAKGLYDGKSFDPSDSAAGCSKDNLANERGECTSGGSNAFVKPVCSITRNPFNEEKTEISDNHLGQGCGNRIQIHVSSGASKITYDLRGQKGTREIAYYGGAYVQALSCYLEQVKKEVRESYSVQKVSPACKAMANDLNGLSANYGSITKAVNEKLKSDLKDQKNIQDIWNCEKKWSENSVGDGKEIGPLRQSAQHLCASRAALESMYNQLLSCEVFARASDDFLSYFGDLDSFREKIDDNVGTKCNKQCKKSCTSKCRSKCKKKKRPSAIRSCAKKCAGTCGTSCGNSCYENNLVPFMQDQLKRWPNDGSCPF